MSKHIKSDVTSGIDNIISYILLTVVIISCKNLNGGFDKSFSVSGGFLIILPSVSWVFFIIFGSSLPFAFSPMVVICSLVYLIINIIVFLTTPTIN